MCGIAGVFGPGARLERAGAMVACQRHRGPDAEGVYLDPDGAAALGHTRLSIIDLSDAGRQPLASADGALRIVFNGEIYNFLELRDELGDYPFRSRTDTEVALAAYERWGEGCLDRFVGMFSFAVWDEREKRLFAARDRFGVKPFYYHETPDGTLLVASEVKALHAGGAPAAPDAATWATYLATGLYDHSEATFWEGVRSLPPGHSLSWRRGGMRVRRWYDLAERAGGDLDERPAGDVAAEYRALLGDSVRLRFRSDVPVGINLSGGLDSSVLLGIVHELQGADSDVSVFTFVTGDPHYDELPWVRHMVARTAHPLCVCRLDPEEVPDLALSVQAHQDEPFGGLPTLAYARLFEEAARRGVKVLLDGQGLDEQWAGYDYYGSALAGVDAAYVQGLRDRPVRPECLTPELRALARPFDPPRPFDDALRNLQYRDARFTKIPRALRFNDRVSMRVSTELREPFLDHRLFELALRQPSERKIFNGRHKHLLREVAQTLVPETHVEAPKRALQTPQREWLRGELREWAEDQLAAALAEWGGAWLDAPAVRREWSAFLSGESDNSFYVWQWVGLALARGASAGMRRSRPAELAARGL